jgi:TonB family protein
MRTTSELLLTFLLNAGWQLALIAGFAVLGDLLLGRALVRVRHLLWVAALAISFLLPLITVLNSPRQRAVSTSAPQEIVIDQSPIAYIAQSSAPGLLERLTSPVHISEKIATGVLALYALFLLYRGARLFQAWRNTRAARRDALPLELSESVQSIVANCQKAVGVSTATILSSSSMPIPATLGVFHPLVILPDALVRGANRDELVAAIGHELVHVSRRDYLLNLIYELIFLPLSFHPAAALMKRRITQTRELRCDELVAERLLHPEVYARSLVKLAGSAMPFTRGAQTITVGIADADILEVRIMSLFKKAKLNTRRNGFLVLAAALLLAIPCVAAASFGFHFNVDPATASLTGQEPSAENQMKREKRALEEQQIKEREREDRELRERIEKETNPEIKAKLQTLLERRQQERDRAKVDMSGYTFTINGEGAQREREIEAKQKAELARLARISMDQAIQIAISQTPGKVLECSLIGEHWEAPGKLAADGQVLYHVVILGGDEANPTTTHVLVNAIDGTIFKNAKERREVGLTIAAPPAAERALLVGVLNSKALEMPSPEYPVIARSAHASGAVQVQITVDENGQVVAARAISGHPLLQAAAVKAARQASFSPSSVNGEPKKVSGVLVYNFVAQ